MDAAVLKDRARRSGSRKAVVLQSKPGGNPPVISLAEVGIDKDLAKQARTFAAAVGVAHKGAVGQFECGKLICSSDIASIGP
jgi:hypothetical protein